MASADAAPQPEPPPSKKRKAREMDDFDEGNKNHGPISQVERRSTLCGSLSGRIADAAVKDMCRIAVDDGNRVSFFGVLAVAVYCLGVLTDAALSHAQRLALLPDTEDANVWKGFFIYAAAFGKGKESQAQWLPQEHRERFYGVLRAHFKPADFALIAAHHDNFYKYLGDGEATANKNFNKRKIIQAHLARYLRAKYALPSTGAAQAIAHRVLHETPLDFDEFRRDALEHFAEDWGVLRAIIGEEARIKRELLGDAGTQTPQSALAYRHHLLASLDDDVARGVEFAKRFHLLPTHACGGQTRFVELDVSCMLSMLPCIKPSHEPFYRRIKGKQNAKEAVRLGDFFHRGNFVGKKAWNRASTVRTNATELHMLFEKNVLRGPRGHARKRPKKFRVEGEKFWNLPKAPKAVPAPQKLAGCDKGYHNLYTTYREFGDGTYELRTVTKKWYDDKSGRTVMREVHARKSAEAQERGLLTAITESTAKTADMDAFLRAVRARRASYAALASHYGTQKLRKLRFFCRTKEQAAQEELIDYITCGGTVTLAIGDCGKTTGFKGSTPGGPLKKIDRLMVKKRHAVFEVNEAYTSKSSLCCPGHLNACQRNGQDPTIFKKGKYSDDPSQMPRVIHGISCCTNCGRTWNRDLVGSANILVIARAQLNGEPRPDRFTRAFWRGRDTNHDGSSYIIGAPTRPGA